MPDRNIRDAEIARAIDADLLRRRQQFNGQPAAWGVLCEAAHVATLNERARMAFVERVAASRGADIALRLLHKAKYDTAVAAAGRTAADTQMMERPALLH